jgi:hypothetical protein
VNFLFQIGFSHLHPDHVREGSVLVKLEKFIVLLDAGEQVFVFEKRRPHAILFGH